MRKTLILHCCIPNDIKLNPPPTPTDYLLVGLLHTTASQKSQALRESIPKQRPGRQGLP